MSNMERAMHELQEAYCEYEPLSLEITGIDLNEYMLFGEANILSRRLSKYDERYYTTFFHSYRNGWGVYCPDDIKKMRELLPEETALYSDRELIEIWHIFIFTFDLYRDSNIRIGWNFPAMNTLVLKKFFNALRGEYHARKIK